MDGTTEPGTPAQGTAGKPEVEDARRLGPLPYIVAALSALPVFGLLFALVAVPWGLATYRRGGRVVLLIGALGFATQFLVVGAIFLFLFNK